MDFISASAFKRADGIPVADWPLGLAKDHVRSAVRRYLRRRLGVAHGGGNRSGGLDGPVLAQARA